MKHRNNDGKEIERKKKGGGEGGERMRHITFIFVCLGKSL